MQFAFVKDKCATWTVGTWSKECAPSNIMRKGTPHDRTWIDTTGVKARNTNKRKERTPPSNRRTKPRNRSTMMPAQVTPPAAPPNRQNEEEPQEEIEEGEEEEEEAPLIMPRLEQEPGQRRVPTAWWTNEGQARLRATRVLPTAARRASAPAGPTGFFNTLDPTTTANMEATVATERRRLEETRPQRERARQQEQAYLAIRTTGFVVDQNHPSRALAVPNNREGIDTMVAGMAEQLGMDPSRHTGANSRMEGRH
jgi:hypothetical protein